MGNVRLSYTDTNKDGFIQPRKYRWQQCDGPWDIINPPNCIDGWNPGEIVEVNNYYPFGLMHNYTATTQNAYQYKYQGQELQETGFYSFKWRNYMPDVGRFFNIDPLAEDYPTWAPYVFSGNRVIDARELEGLEPKSVHKTYLDAAENFGNQYNNMSIRMNGEIATRFYKMKDANGVYDSYTRPYSSGPGSGMAFPELADAPPKGAVEIGAGHTHGAGMKSI